MMTDQTAYKRLFTPSGCLKLETLQLFEAYTLSDKETKIVEGHLMECELCSDALKGIKLVKNPGKLSAVIKELNENLNKKLTNRTVKEKPKTRLITERIIYFSAAASVLILVGVFAYLKFNKPLMLQQTTVVLNEEFTERIPTTPLPIVTKDKRSKEKDNTKQLNNVPIKNKVETVTSESDKSVSESLQEKELQPLEQMKPATKGFPDPDKTVFIKSGDEAILSEESVEFAAIDIASTQPVEYYLGEVIIHAEKVMINQSSKMANHATDNLNERNATQTEMNQRSVVPTINKDESKGNSKNLISEASQLENDQKPEHFFNAVDSMPEFPGGNQAMLDFLKKNLHYPAFALENHIQGTINISFIIEETGKISSVNLLRGIGGRCDEEAIRVVRSMPDWSPGYVDGKPVRVRFSLPITFKLN